MENKKYNLKVAMAQHIQKDIKRENLTFGEKVSDIVSSGMGCWKYIIIVNIFIFGWMIIQYLLKSKAYDPYPYILLNFCLSYSAAVGQPILQMSANRQSSIDRTHMQIDMEVNVKTKELIENLHEKINKQSQEISELKELITNITLENKSK